MNHHDSVVRKPVGRKPLAQASDEVCVVNPSSRLSTASTLVNVEPQDPVNYHIATESGRPLAGRRQSAPNPTTQAHQIAVQPPPALPAGWAEMRDPTGRSIFYNLTTNESTWERPQPIVNKIALPPGWDERKTPDGRTFYLNVDTKCCTWEAQSAPINANLATKVTQPQVVAQVTSTQVSGALASMQPLQHTQSTPAKSNQFITLDVDLNQAASIVPGVSEAMAIASLSQKPTRILRKKLASDLSTASTAAKDSTMVAASLATRQAVIIGTTMVSPRKMKKASKKMVIGTGAVGLKGWRACKDVMRDIKDAADRPQHLDEDEDEDIETTTKLSFSAATSANGQILASGRLDSANVSTGQITTNHITATGRLSYGGGLSISNVDAHRKRIEPRPGVVTTVSGKPATLVPIHANSGIETNSHLMPAPLTIQRPGHNGQTQIESAGTMQLPLRPGTSSHPPQRPTQVNDPQIRPTMIMQAPPRPLLAQSASTGTAMTIHRPSSIGPSQNSSTIVTFPPIQPVAGKPVSSQPAPIRPGSMISTQNPPSQQQIPSQLPPSYSSVINRPPLATNQFDRRRASAPLMSSTLPASLLPTSRPNPQASNVLDDLGEDDQAYETRKRVSRYQNNEGRWDIENDYIRYVQDSDHTNLEHHHLPNSNYNQHQERYVDQEITYELTPGPGGAQRAYQQPEVDFLSQQAQLNAPQELLLLQQQQQYMAEPQYAMNQNTNVQVELEQQIIYHTTPGIAGDALGAMPPTQPTMNMVEGGVDNHESYYSYSYTEVERGELVGYDHSEEIVATGTNFAEKTTGHVEIDEVAGYDVEYGYVDGGELF